MKISALTPVSSLDGTEVSPCNQSSTTVRTTLQAIANLFKGTRGTAIASAATVDLGAATGSNLHITGTTTITSLGTAAAGVEREAIFDGALTLTYNATSLILPGSANITTAANDSARFISEGSGNWRCVKYQRANGQPLVAGGLTNPMTTSQDIIVGGSSGTPGRLAVGSAGQALVVNGSGSLAYAGGEGISEPVNALSISSNAITINCANGDYFTLSMTANVTSVTVSNAPASGKAQTVMVEIKQDATGSRTISWPASFKWTSGTAGVLSTGANKVDVLAITTFDQGTTWRATLAKDFS
jgi:hypothetical protein